MAPASIVNVEQPRRRGSAGAVLIDRRGAPSGRAKRRIAAATGIVLSGAAHAQCTPVWQDVGGVWGGAASPTYAWVDSLDPSSDPIIGSAIYVGGSFLGFGPLAGCGVTSRDARSWRPLGVGICQPGSHVYGVTAIEPPTGSAIEPGVVFSGTFWEAGGVPVEHIARWSSPTWNAMGQWTWPRYSATLYGGPGMASPAPCLYSGGMGNSTDGSLPYTLARWDGQRWESVGGGVAPFAPQTDSIVHALMAYDDDGSGPRLTGLYAGGRFWYAGGVVVRHTARWDGAGWEPLGTGTLGTVESLCVFDVDGSGPDRPFLFAGGQFDTAGTAPDADGLARWDGQQWYEVPGWSHGPVKTMAVFDDDGTGPNNPALFVGGFFNNSPGGPGNQIAKWDGRQWSTLKGPTGVPGVTGWGQATEVKALAVFDEDGDGPNPGGLYVGGFFTSAGGVPMNSIARWGCPAPAQCYANCSLDFHPVTGAHILSVADFGCFQTKFVQQDPYADCNADGSLTVADFGCFQTKFAAGCP